jgi:hypothetical protein
MLAICAASGGAAAEAPTDNPVATFYDGPEGYPAWTDRIHWSRVINMKTYAKGANDFEKFESARDELAAKGGGVLYYPAGTYDFSTAPMDGPKGRGLMLRSGVVIRGEAPGGKPKATTGKMALATKFRFGFRKRAGGSVPRDWAFVGLAPEKGKRLKDVNDVGVCWVHLDGGVIWFGPDLKWGRSWSAAGSWKSKKAQAAWKDRAPDGTHPWDPFCGAPPLAAGYVGAGSGRFVFGCVLTNAAAMNGMVDEGFGPDGFYMAKFTPRIGVYGSRVLVANNLLPRPDKCFLYKQTTRRTRSNPPYITNKTRTSTIMFDYGKTCGVDVNKDLLGMVHDNGRCGGYFEEGVVVIDNNVFNHGHKGFNLSGEWMTVRHNRNEREYLKEGRDVYGIGAGWELTLDGHLESSYGGTGNVSDNLSRAFDTAGWNVWVDHNWMTNTGSDPGNDGEAILAQLHGGTHILSWAVTRNTHVKGDGERGYFAGWHVDCLGMLIAWNDTPGFVGTVVRGNEIADFAVIANKAAGGIRPAQGPDVPLTSAKDKPSAPKAVKAEVYQGDAVKVTWTDGSDNEAGFRVERRIAGGEWTTIAYRPPQIQAHEKNPAAWIDFLAPPGCELAYRVIAINEKDEGGAGGPTAPVVLTRPAGRE